MVCSTASTRYCFPKSFAFWPKSLKTCLFLLVFAILVFTNIFGAIEVINCKVLHQNGGIVYNREFVISIPGRVISKTFKMVPIPFSLDAGKVRIEWESYILLATSGLAPCCNLHCISRHLAQRYRNGDGRRTMLQLALCCCTIYVEMLPFISYYNH